MSDTSTLIAIKYKGQMIGIPQDSSVSWNDLEDKPTTSSTFTLQQITNDTEANNLTQLYKSTDGQTVSNFTFYKKNSDKDLEVNFASNLVSASEYKNDYWDYAYYYSGDNLVKLTDKELDYVVIKGVYPPYIMVAGIALDYTNKNNSYMDYFYSNIGLPTPTLSVTTINQKYSSNGKILFRLKWDNSYISSFKFTACRPIVNEEYTFLPQYINAYTKSEADNKFALDTSVSELWDTSAGPDLSDYYTKTQIDTSIVNNYASKNDISAFITSNDVSTFITSNDVSTFVTNNDVSNKLEANDVSKFLTANDVSTDQPFHFFTNTTDSTKKGIVVKGGDGYAANIGNNALLMGPFNRAQGILSAAFGYYVNAYNNYEVAFGKFNNSSTNTDTLFTVGNGGNQASSNKHNALEIKLNGDVYIPDTDDTTSSYYYKKPMKRIQDLFVLDTSVSKLWDTSTQGGGSGISLQYLTQAEYDALLVKDPSTLYLIEETL